MMLFPKWLLETDRDELTKHEVWYETLDQFEHLATVSEVHPLNNCKAGTLLYIQIVWEVQVSRHPCPI